jgi:hypothetical protein
MQKKARANQRVGGQIKGSSNLTEADKLDIRSEIAALAGVSAGNVTKVKQLARTADPEILQALREGDIRIHRAWGWSKEPADQQRQLLRLYRSQRGIRKKIRTLVSRHQRANASAEQKLGSLRVPHFTDLFRRLSALECSDVTSVSVAVINSPGKALFITEELLHALNSQQELPLECPPDSC